MLQVDGLLHVVEVLVNGKHGALRLLVNEVFAVRILLDPTAELEDGAIGNALARGMRLDLLVGPRDVLHMPSRVVDVVSAEEPAVIRDYLTWEATSDG